VVLQVKDLVNLVLDSLLVTLNLLAFLEFKLKTKTAGICTRILNFKLPYL